MTEERYRLETDFVRVKVRGFYRDAPERIKTLWAKSVKSKKPGIRIFMKVSAEGEKDFSYNEKTNVVTETTELLVCTEANVVEVKPAIMNLKYGELEVER